MLVGGCNPSEQYESIGMIIPNIWTEQNKKVIPNHQPGWDLTTLWQFFCLGKELQALVDIRQADGVGGGHLTFFPRKVGKPQGCRTHFCGKRHIYVHNIYVCIYIYICIYICIYTNMYICSYIYIYVSICAYTQICTYVYVYIYICKYMYIQVCIYIYMYM